LILALFDSETQPTVISHRRQLSITVTTGYTPCPENNGP